MKAETPYVPFAELEPSKFDFGKIMNAFPFSGIDLESLIAGQKKNIDALNEANRVAVSGLQALAKRQGEMLTDALTAAYAASQQLGASKDSRELLAKQAEVARDALEKGLANVRQLAEMVSTSTNKAIDVIGKRAAEALQEVKSQAEKK